MTGLEVLADGLRFGEGPRWHSGKLWFSDMYDHAVKTVDLDGQVLLLGVTAAKLTLLHLAEHRASYPGKTTIPNGVAMMVDGRRQWVTWNELDVHDDDFVDVVEAFAADTGLVSTGRVGEATAQLMPARSLVEFATNWFSTHR